jgi:hypothetical protein
LIDLGRKWTSFHEALVGSTGIPADIRLDVEMMKATSHSTVSLGNVKHVLLLIDIVGLIAASQCS